MASKVIIEAHRSHYQIGQVERTMTVGELIQYLMDNFDTESNIYLSHDNGYTYGGINFEDINESWDDEENEDEEDY